MLRKIFVSATGMACTFSLFAQDSTVPAPKPIISGAVDVYYRYNLNAPTKASGTYNNFTSFTNSQNSFELGMASVKFEHSIGSVGMVADLGFGKRAEEFSYADEKTRFAIKQLYLTYSPWKNVKFTAGSWATHIGYELVDASANRNYSMSYMFSKGPFLHTGIKADFTAGRNGFMIGIADPTDLKSASFSRKFLLAQYSIASKDAKTKAYLNFQGGRSGGEARVRQFDLVVTEALNDKFSIGYNGTIAATQAKVDGKFGDASSWWGSALYLNADPKTWFGLTLRAEYFKDEKLLTDVFAGTGLSKGGSVFATTLSGNFKIYDLIIIPELRYDAASKDIFVKHDGSTTKSSPTVLVAAIYKF